MTAAKSASAYNIIYWDIFATLEKTPLDPLELECASLKEARAFRTRLYYFRKALGYDSRTSKVPEAKARALRLAIVADRYKFQTVEREGRYFVRIIMGTEDVTASEVPFLESASKALHDRREDSYKRELKQAAFSRGFDQDTPALKSSSEDGGESILNMFGVKKR